MSLEKTPKQRLRIPHMVCLRRYGEPDGEMKFSRSPSHEPSLYLKRDTRVRGSIARGGSIANKIQNITYKCPPGWPSLRQVRGADVAQGEHVRLEEESPDFLGVLLGSGIPALTSALIRLSLGPESRTRTCIRSRDNKCRPSFGSRGTAC